jgi:DNA-directed RNA polymerase specialized sigma24 family protein
MMWRIARRTARTAVLYYRLPRCHYDDLVNACLTAVWRADGTLTGDRERGGFYRAVARRAAWRYARDVWKARKKEVPLRPAHDRGAVPDPPAELPGPVVLAVASLSRRHRELVEGMFLKGLSPPEYARLTGGNYYSIRQAAFHALRDLRNRLGVSSPCPAPAAPPAARSGRR